MGQDIAVSIDYGKILGVKLDLAQQALDNQVWMDVKQYMPMKTGALINSTQIQNMSVSGEVWLWANNIDYGHYLYEGEKYIDPVYGVGGFFSESYGWWSRPGVEKVPSGEPLTYSRDTARAHWGQVAIQQHGQQWVELVQRVVSL